MRRHLVLLGALFATSVFATAAQASTITLSLDTAEDPKNFVADDPLSDGTLVFGMRRGYFLQRFVATVTADDGGTVSGCLASGAELVLIDSSGAAHARSGSCPAQDGLFEMRPVGGASIQRPSVLRAALKTAATTQEATPRTVSAASSNRVVMLVQPTIVNESPKTHYGPGDFPLQVRVGLAPPRPKAGTFVLQLKRGSIWTTVVTRKPDVNGRFAMRVPTRGTLTVYRIRFIPAPGSGWLRITYELRITTTSA